MIPMGVTIIGNGAFANCAELKSATIPSSVKNIDSNAFANCGSLQSIVIPEGVESIEEDSSKEAPKNKINLKDAFDAKGNFKH